MTQPYTTDQKDSGQSLTIVFDTFIHEDKIIGNYNYDILTGYEGINLEIKKDNKFTVEHWSDVGGGRRFRNKGKWKLENNNLLLDNNYLFDKELYSFKVFKYDNLIFIVPKNNIDKFDDIANANSNAIIRINREYEYEFKEARHIIREMDFFRKCCLIKMKPSK